MKRKLSFALEGNSRGMKLSGMLNSFSDCQHGRNTFSKAEKCRQRRSLVARDYSPNCNSTKWRVKTFEEWQSARSNEVAANETLGFDYGKVDEVQDLTVDITQMSPLSLNFQMTKFVGEIGNSPGGRYPSRSLYQMLINLLLFCMKFIHITNRSISTLYDLHLSSFAVLFCHAARFLAFKLVFTSALRSHFPMFSPMLFLLVKKMEIQFYSVLFCPPNSPKSITNSLNFAHSAQAISCR